MLATKFSSRRLTARTWSKVLFIIMPAVSVPVFFKGFIQMFIVTAFFCNACEVKNYVIIIHVNLCQLLFCCDPPTMDLWPLWDICCRSQTAWQTSCCFFFKNFCGMQLWTRAAHLLLCFSQLTFPPSEGW